jgi:predicted alpha/beta hydrolase family esterase
MAKKQALFLQSWLSQTTDIWYPWIKSELKKCGYTVFLPDLPTIRTQLPDLNKMLQKVKKTLVIDKNTIIIGHSIGTLVALRLAEKYKFKKMILVSAWDFDDLFKAHRLFWKTKINHRKIKNNVKDIVVIQGEHDPYVTASTAEEMSKRFNAKFVLIKGLGHFGNDDKCVQLPQILGFV